jgi:hypothetical protein
LENAWTEFSTSMMNSDFIKGGIDLLTAFVTALNKATSVFDGWLGSVSKIGMIISLFRVAKVMFKKFGDKVIALFTPVGDKIADSIIKGLEGRKDDVVDAAEKVAKAAATGAKTATEEPVETNTEGQETKKPGLFKRARNAASTFVNNAAMGKSLAKAKTAGDFASNAEE